MYRLLCKK